MLVGQETVFANGDKLWKQAMINVQSYVVSRGGTAVINKPVSKRIDWYVDYLDVEYYKKYGIQRKRN